MALHAELLETIDALEPHLGAWDALAAASERPYCAPGWMLSWLRCVAPADALLRACLVHDDGELIGVGPFWARGQTGRYGVLAERASSPVEPLCARGREGEVAAAFGELLGGARPRPAELELQGSPGASPWPRLLAEHLPGFAPAAIERTRVEPLPKVSLRHAGMEAWLGTRSRNFRQQLRRAGRQLDDAGAQLRVSSSADVDRDVDALSKLHHARWRSRGGSRALNPQVEAMLKLAARELGENRLQLLALDVDGVPISAHLFVRAGTTRAYWLGGFDDSWAKCRPSVHVLAAAVEAGIASDDDWLELGPGGQHYKYRFADAEEELAWVALTSSPKRA